MRKTGAGEAQVVAYLQAEANPAPLHYGPVATWGVAALLAAVGEEVVLVIVRHDTIGSDEVETVVIGTSFTDSYGTGKGSTSLLGHALHPCEAFVVLFCHTLRRHHEARAPHLGENEEFTLSSCPQGVRGGNGGDLGDGNTGQQLFCCPVVGFYVFPTYVGL